MRIIAPKGFTLIELLITVAVVAILGAMIVPSLIGFKRSQDLDSASRLIVATLREAQQRSITQDAGGQYGVRFVNDATDYFQVIQATQQAQAGGCPSPETVTFTGKQYAIPSSIEFTDPSLGSKCDVFFEKLTGLPNPSDAISLQIAGDPTSSRAITVNANGTIAH